MNLKISQARDFLMKKIVIIKKNHLYVKKILLEKSHLMKKNLMK